MSLWRYVSPRWYVFSPSAAFTMGRAATGQPMGELAYIAAQANVIIDIPVDIQLEDDFNQNRPILQVDVYHKLGTSSLLSACGAVFYEILHSAGAAPSALLPNQLGPSTYASGTAFTGTVPSALSSTPYLTTFTAPVMKNQGASDTYGINYRRHTARTTLWLELSANVPASAVWEHYGTWVKYGNL